jgi:flagellar basal body P-ring protein FlgI
MSQPPPLYTRGDQGAMVLQGNEGEAIGFRLRQPNFTTAQDIINFINSHENIDQRLGVLEEFQDVATRAAGGFLASINTI